jgi:succinyl-diaminopimelate desuccinylase
LRHGITAAPDGDEAARALELLKLLVEAESINPPGATAGPAEIARVALESAGIALEVVSADPLKPNLVAQLQNGAGPHVVLNAHLDTVPPGDIAAWTKQPLHLTEEGERLYGLGAGNMKAAAAAMIMAVMRLDGARDRWRGTITLTLVADECVFGPDGAAHLLKTRPDLRGDMLIAARGRATCSSPWPRRG